VSLVQFSITSKAEGVSVHGSQFEASVYYSRQLYTVSIRFHGGAELFFGLNPQAESSLIILLVALNKPKFSFMSLANNCSPLGCSS
jgi:hypothetical protein